MLVAGVDWGTVPDWFAAIGTTLAFAVAFAVLLRELVERRNQQARLVLCWLESMGYAGDGQYVDLVIRNASTEPVYDMQVSFDSPIRIESGDIGEDYCTPMVAPGDLRIPGELLSALPLRARCTYVFTDANGRRWVRSKGNLTTWESKHREEQIIALLRGSALGRRLLSQPRPSEADR